MNFKFYSESLNKVSEKKVLFNTFFNIEKYDFLIFLRKFKQSFREKKFFKIRFL